MPRRTHEMSSHTCCSCFSFPVASCVCGPEVEQARTSTEGALVPRANKHLRFEDRIRRSGRDGVCPCGNRSQDSTTSCAA
jgi:hypothetical protein